MFISPPRDRTSYFHYDYTITETACHDFLRELTFLFRSNLLISSIHFFVNWLFEVVFSPLLKTLLHIVSVLDLSFFSMISPLSENC